MKRLFLLFLFILPISATASDITTPFKLWLLNNEARVFSSLAADKILTEKICTPFAFIPPGNSEATRAEESLWETHRKIYVLLDEAQSVYSIARQFGNGRFAIVVKQARPELWSLIPLLTAKPLLIPLLSSGFRWSFHTTLLKSLHLDPERDLDLSARMSKAFKKLNDEEMRLMYEYFASFSALYPSDTSIRVLRGFIETASQKPFGTGLKELLKPSGNLPAKAAVAATAPEEDPLAELEKLAQFDAGETSTINSEESASNTPEVSNQPATLEPPPPGVEDLFNIWE